MIFLKLRSGVKNNSLARNIFRWDAFAKFSLAKSMLWTLDVSSFDQNLGPVPILSDYRPPSALSLRVASHRINDFGM
jgi:hypothetical protein